MNKIEYITHAFLFCALFSSTLITIIIRIKKGSDLLPQKGIDISKIHIVELLGALLVSLYFSLYFFGAPEAHDPKALVFPRTTQVIVAQLTMCIPAFAILLRMKKGVSRFPAHWRPQQTRHGLTLLGWSLAAVILVLIFSSAFRQSGMAAWLAKTFESVDDTQTIVRYLREGPMPLRITISITAVIFAPLIEEIMFRGYLYPILKKYAGTFTAVLFTSLLFGMVHNNISAIIPLTFFGAVLVFLYEKTKTIWTPIIAHALFNATTVIVSFCFYS